MTQDEIIEMAKKSGASPDGRLWLMYSKDLEVFAKLVAAKEREACAKLCHNVSVKANNSVESEYHSGRWRGSQQCYEAIRARGEA